MERLQLFGHMQHSYYFTYMEYGLLYYTIPCAVIATSKVSADLSGF